MNDGIAYFYGWYLVDGFRKIGGLRASPKEMVLISAGVENNIRSVYIPYQEEYAKLLPIYVKSK